MLEDAKIKWTYVLKVWDWHSDVVCRVLEQMLRGSAHGDYTVGTVCMSTVLWRLSRSTILLRLLRQLMKQLNLMPIIVNMILVVSTTMPTTACLQSCSYKARES